MLLDLCDQTDPEELRWSWGFCATPRTLFDELERLLVE